MKDTNKKFEQLIKEDSSRLKGKILEKLKSEGGIPSNWLAGRLSNVHTPSKERERADDMEDTNFPTRYSGQPDLEEHHEEFPSEILDQTVGEFLDSLKGKSEEHYKHVEDMIEKFFMSSKEQPTDEQASFSLDDLVPHTIPRSHSDNDELKKDLRKALNIIFKKHKIQLSIKESVNEGRMFKLTKPQRKRLHALPRPTLKKIAKEIQDVVGDVNDKTTVGGSEDPNDYSFLMSQGKTAVYKKYGVIESINERKEFPSKELLIKYMVKYGHNPKDSKRITDVHYDYVKKHYQGWSIPKIIDVIWTI